MNTAALRAILASLALATAAACTDAPVVSSPTPTPVTPTPTPAPTITVSAPSLVQPASGATTFGWPTFTWNNATKTNTTNALVYRFDLSTREDFATVSHTATVSEGSGSTSYTPPSTLGSPTEGNLYWRVVAIDQVNAVQSPPSDVLRFAFYENTWQNQTAVQLYGGLWPSAKPTGATGRARLGPGWAVATRRSFAIVDSRVPMWRPRHVRSAM